MTGRIVSAGLAALQGGHTRGGEQHSENSDTEHGHTRVGQAALVVVLLAVGHTGLLGAGLPFRLRGPEHLVESILCGVDVGLPGVLVVVHPLSGGNPVLQNLPYLLSVPRLVSLLGLPDGGLERLLLHRFDGGLLFQGPDGLVQRNGCFLGGGLSDLTGFITLEHTFRSLDGLV